MIRIEHIAKTGRGRHEREQMKRSSAPQASDEFEEILREEIRHEETEKP